MQSPHSDSADGHSQSADGTAPEAAPTGRRAGPKHARARRNVRRAGATALVAAFVGGLLSGAPAAQAAPPGDGASDTPDDEKAGRTDVPPVWPRPQALRARGADVPLGTEATLVSDGDADPYALAAVRGMLRDAGVRTVHEARPGDRLPEGGPVFRVGTEAAEGALRALRAPERDDLPSGGYRLAAGRAGGRATVALSGVGDDGLFHAAQTLRQLITDRREGAEDAEGAEGGTGGKVVPGVVIRDWPTTSVRGVTEGFYGQPWSQQERLDHLDFLGRTKQNRYLYAPGTDPYRQATRWRDPYPAAQRADFRELAQHAAHNHVVLGWAVSPGQGLCFSSAGDRKALLRKLDAMHALGVRAFQLQFDDVSYDEWHCDGDAEKYGTGPEAAAEAQAELTNAVAAHLKARHGGAGSPVPLSVLPTEFYQEGRTAYRKALSRALADGVEVAWTGVGVVPRTITGGELADVRGAFPGHPVVTMDNYPVNDYAPGRLFLGPYRGRQPAVATGSAAVLANAMAQPTASRIPLFTAADYAWNPRDYQPGESWKAAVDDLAGPDRRTRAAVHALAGNDASSILGGDESAYLRPAIRDFWTAYGDGTLGSAAAADDLRAAFRTMRHAPERVPAGLGREARPWLRQLALLGEAGERSVDMLAAQAAGDGGAAWAAQLDVRRLRDEAAKSSVTVGKGVLKEFVDRALKAGDDWTGVRKNAFGSERPHGGPTARPGSPLEAAVDGDTGSAYRAGAPPVTELPARGRGEIPAPPDGLTVGLPRARSLAAVTVLTGPAADGGATRADIEAHVPGEGWQRIGRLSESGSTEAAAHGLRADALRLRWSAGSDAPVVHEITPWYADTPDASLALSRDDTYASIGGGPAEVAVRLTAQRPVEVRGRLKAEAPEGFTVRAPSRVTVPRGGTAEVPLRVTAGPEVRPGTYEVPVSFGDERRTLTVRAFPAVGGPDLARSAEAASSGDETPDFPAPHVNDGKAHTRWSSPAEDGAWVQLELARPARVGEVRLHWQDAYAAGYRVQVSPDGRRWRTAATVRDGAGGRETVRMDAPADTRFVRVQGDKRATRFGYSLWSVEVYAVREEKREEKDVKKEPEKQEPGKQGQDGER